MNHQLFVDLGRDTAYACRLTLRNRGFTIAAVLTLAVSIGGNTAMFSVINALFFQPLSARAPQDLVRIYTGESTVSLPNVQDVRDRTTVFDGLFEQGQSFVSLSADPLPVRLSAGLVSANYFSVIGASPLMGRTFREDDRRVDVVVLGERLWRTRFGSSTSMVGSTLTLDGQRREVIGIMPRAFRGIAPPGFTHDLWIPLDLDGVHRGLAIDRAAARFEAYGRLKRGVSIEAAAAAVAVVGAQMAAEHPDVNQRFRETEVFAASGLGLYRGVGKTLLPVFVFVGLLTVVAAFVLGIGCANLAGLLLGRAVARRREIAVRLSLGAGRGRLVRQLLTESLVLAVMGGIGGFALARALTSAAVRLTTRLPFPIDLALPLDRRALAYTLVVSCICALLFGLVPARRASRVELAASLKPEGGTGPARQRFRQFLIVGQVAFSALLLFWSGLFARSLMEAGRVDPGFDPSGVLLAEVQLADDRPGAIARVDSAFVELQRRVQSLPGVERAGWSSVVPLALTGNERFKISRVEEGVGAAGTWIVASRLSPDWFATVRIPVVAGRDFTWADRIGAEPVAIINDTLARQFWNGAALGRRFTYGSQTLTVVGVVRDSKYWTLGETISPTVYLPFRQSPALFPPTLHVRTSNVRATAERIRQAVQDVVPGGTVELKPMSTAVAAAVMPARVGAIATAGFGLLGALLATLGVYGLIFYVVVQRSREMAIRRAIGAPTRHIIRVVVGHSAVLTLAGLTLGIVAGALAAPLFGGLLVNISPRDPLTILLTTVVVLATGALASAPPALRATRVDPLAALKAE